MMKQPPSAKIIKRMQFDPEFQPTLVTPVIKHRVVSAYQEAKQIIENARKEAARIREEAAETIQRAIQEREAERKRGYEEGYQEGLGQLTERMFEVAQSHEKILNEAEPQIIRMVMDISEKVIGREIEKGGIVDIVKQAIDQSAGKKIIVRLNGVDVPVMRERESELYKALTQGQTVSVREDDSIPAGGCVVETEMGSVDARLETQLKAIKKALGLET